jgi:hypothetical protein
VVKVYRSIRGIDINEYRRIKNKEYRQRGNKTPGTPTTPITRSTKADVVSEVDAAKMKELHNYGLALTKIAKAFGVTRYVAQQVVFLR